MIMCDKNNYFEEVSEEETYKNMNLKPKNVILKITFKQLTIV